MTVIELRQLRPERYALLLDTGEKINVTLNMVADFSLYTGRELDNDELQNLRNASAFAHTKERALWMLGARPLGTQELYDKLLAKGERERDAAAAVAWLLENGLLNDEDYAAAIVQRYSAKGYGIRRIQNELYRHKLPKELWENALTELPEPDDTIDRLLQNRFRGGIPDRAERKRAADALSRRGFRWEEIKSALDRYMAEVGDED